MKTKLLFILTCLLISPVLAKKLEPKLKIHDDDLRQGEFFQVHVKDSKKKPRLWFNAKEFEMFELEDGEEKLYRALVPVENLTKPGSYTILATTGKWSQELPVKIIDNEKPISKITLSGEKSGISATKKELNEVGSGIRARSKNKLWAGKFKLPTKARITSAFGVKRSYNGAPVSSYHKGLDFGAFTGDPVHAPADGKVIVAGYEKDGYAVHGNCVILDHGHAVTSIYMHLSKIDVKKGQRVTKGEKLGEVGHTGISTAPHLHWGVYLYGTSVEPELFVKDEVL